MKSIVLSLIVCVLAIGSCKTSQPNAQSGEKQSLIMTKPKSFKIILGTGGGVSGFYTEYWIKHDGQVIRKNYDSELPKLIKTMDKSQALDFYTKLLQTGFLDVNLNAPGNINYYIELKYDDKTHKVLWGKPSSQTVPAEIQTYYDNTMNFISK